MEEGIRWWKEEMAGQKELNIPTDRERPEVTGVKGGRVKIGDRGRRSKGIEEDREGRRGDDVHGTEGIGCIAVPVQWGRRISVGTVVANRGEVGMEKLIGYFANTIVMRSESRREGKGTGGY